MIVTSTIVMYGLMYLNTWQFDHIWFSQTRMWMALYLVRSQDTVGDAAWMKAMIPHHSIAILTSTRAELRDPRVRQLADAIIRTQKREIAEMEFLDRGVARWPRCGAERPMIENAPNASGDTKG